MHWARRESIEKQEINRISRCVSKFCGYSQSVPSAYFLMQFNYRNAITYNLYDIDSVGKIQMRKNGNSQEYFRVRLLNGLIRD